MRHTFTTILFFVIFSASAQEIDSLKQTMLSIQEEMKLNVNRFNGKISVENETTIKYDNEVLLIYNTDNKYKLIFELGIFYPSLLTGPVKTGLEREKELNSMIIRNDSLRITDFKETSSKESIKIKRFTFLLFYKGLSNPTEYFIELTNDKATRETDIETFIKGAKLKSLVKGSLLI